MRMRMVDYLMKRIYDAGAHHVFFVPGTGCMFLTDALARNKDIKAVSVHHEQSAGMAALTYAKVNETIGACVVTTGCGGTNAITAVLHAWNDSVPCVFISGQAARHQTVRNAKVPLRQMGRQEADIIALVEPITKYATMINSVEDIVKSIDIALHEATTGRKGPVWLDVPMDIQNAVFDIDAAVGADLTDTQIFEPDVKDIEEVQKALKEARRPVILAGNGIRLSKSVEELNKFIHSYKIPMTYSRLGHDIVKTDDPLSIGMVGMLGASRAGNFAVQNSDLVLVLGSRLSINTTGYEYEKFAREAKVIVVDIDKDEHSKDTVRIDKFIQSDVKLFLDKMNENPFITDSEEWRNKCARWKEIFPVCPTPLDLDGKIDMYRFVDALSSVMSDNSTVISDAGTVYFIVSSAIRIKNKNQRSITSGGQAEMGYSLPAAIGAAFAANCPVIAINGDGSVMMNLQELETIAFNKLNIKLFVMNNNGYSCIRSLMNNSFRGRVIGCDESTGLGLPNFSKIASAFDIPYIKIEGYENLNEKIKDVLNMDGPTFIEVISVEDQKVLMTSTAMNKQKRFVTRPLEDQAPFLERELFLKEMIIEAIDQ